LIYHLPAVSAFTLPHPVSYQRSSPDFSAWAGSGGGFVSWGIQNKEAAIRGVEDNHWEIKTMDAMANPMLGVAAIVLAGVGGVKRGLQLETKSADGELIATS
jgi:glutamine synthetase